MKSMVQRFFDSLQLRLHLLGMHRAATFFGRFGSPALDTYDRPTVPDMLPYGGRVGASWALDELPSDVPLVALDFDPTFNKNINIDVSRDVAFPNSKQDVN